VENWCQLKGTEDPDVWEMGLGFKDRKAGEYAYGNTYAKAFPEGQEPEIGDIVTVRPMLMRRFIKDDGSTGIAWMFPNLQEVDYTRKEPDDEKVVNQIIEASLERQELKGAIPRLHTFVYLDTPGDEYFDFSQDYHSVILNTTDSESYWFWNWLLQNGEAGWGTLRRKQLPVDEARRKWLERWQPLSSSERAYKYVATRYNSLEGIEKNNITQVMNTSLLGCINKLDRPDVFLFHSFESTDSEQEIERVISRLGSFSGKYLIILPENISVPPDKVVAVFGEKKAIANFTEAKRAELPPDWEELPREKQRKELEKYHVRGIIHPDMIKQVKDKINDAKDQETINKLWKKLELFRVQNLNEVKRVLQEIDDKRGGKGEQEINDAIEKLVDFRPPELGEKIVWEKVYNRGNSHVDLRMAHPSGKYLSSSWTCMVSKVAFQRLSDGEIVFLLRDRMLENQPGDQWLATKKGVQPLDWLTIVSKDDPIYWRPPGTVGATEYTAGCFIWVADFEHVPMVQKSDFHEYAIKWLSFSPDYPHNDPKDLNGRWDWKKVELKAGEQWLGLRPWESQVPYILTKDKEKEEKKAKQENIELIWNERWISFPMKFLKSKLDVLLSMCYIQNAGDKR